LPTTAIAASKYYIAYTPHMGGTEIQMTIKLRDFEDEQEPDIREPDEQEPDWQEDDEEDEDDQDEDELEDDEEEE
jgi:hypothetical protein